MIHKHNRVFASRAELQRFEDAQLVILLSIAFEAWGYWEVYQFIDFEV